MDISHNTTERPTGLDSYTDVWLDATKVKSHSIQVTLASILRPYQIWLMHVLTGIMWTWYPRFSISSNNSLVLTHPQAWILSHTGHNNRNSDTDCFHISRLPWPPKKMINDHEWKCIILYSPVRCYPQHSRRYSYHKWKRVALSKQKTIHNELCHAMPCQPAS